MQNIQSVLIQFNSIQCSNQHDSIQFNPISKQSPLVCRSTSLSANPVKQHKNVKWKMNLTPSEESTNQIKKSITSSRWFTGSLQIVWTYLSKGRKIWMIILYKSPSIKGRWGWKRIPSMQISSQEWNKPEMNIKDSSE